MCKDIFVVYVDFTKDTNEVFYVGKGNLYRTKNFKRNKYYNSIFNKHGVVRTILVSSKSLKFINEQERRYIAEFHTYAHDPNAVRLAANFTKGGEGTPGYKQTEHAKNLLRLLHVGKPLSDKHKNAIRLGVTGEKNPFYGKKHDILTIECMKEKLSHRMMGKNNPFYGKKHTKETRKKLSLFFKDKPLSQSHKKSISKSLLGNQNTKGHKLTISHREKLSYLNIENVLYIRQHTSEYSIAELAKQLNVPWHTVYNVIRGKTWRGV